jgi:hypothetical protein
MSYTYAWLVIAAAGAVGTLGLWFLTREFTSGRLKAILRLVPPLLLLLPAPVPNYEGQLAPAFIVFIFESLFQAQGEPLQAGVILLCGLTVGVIAGALIGRSGKASAGAREAR